MNCVRRLHDIVKPCSMIIEGGGWEVIDRSRRGAEKFLKALDENPMHHRIVGIATTQWKNMRK